MNFVKYPRTEHLLGSKFLDSNNFDLNFKNTEQISFPILSNDELFIIEEKMDGIGLGICFINDIPHIQQRGHIMSIDKLPYLLKNFKTWIQHNEELLYCMLTSQYTLFGEWLEYKHTVFYNNLPSLFLEYDIFDHKNNLFLSTEKRYEVIKNQLPSVKVVLKTPIINLSIIKELISHQDISHFSNKEWNNDFQQMLLKYSSLINDTLIKSFEGLYIKIENNEQTKNRFKWIKKDFFNIVLKNNHWKNKPIILNQLQKKSLNFHI